jgi:hypothetical protein
MTDRREQVENKVAGLGLSFLRQLVLDVWRLRGFGVAYRYEDEGAEFVAVRRMEGVGEQTEVVAIVDAGDTDDVRAVSEVADSVDAAGEVRAVAVAKRFGPGAERTAQELGVETVDAERLADLIVRGEYYWTLYRWVALDEAGRTDEPTVVGSDEAPLRYREGIQGVELGRTTAKRIGVGGGDVVRVSGEIAGVASTSGILEKDSDYVAVDGGDADALGAEEGDPVAVEVLDAGEARRVYVMCQPDVDAELAAEIWKGYAPHRGTELSQPYEDGEIRTMVLEVLPHDYCYVDDETDVVVEGYAGARRVFE